jgi:hypothetical protein
MPKPFLSPEVVERDAADAVGHPAEAIIHEELRDRWESQLSRCGRPTGTPALVRELARRSLWLEQELIALNPRLHGALEGAGRT